MKTNENKGIGTGEGTEMTKQERFAKVIEDMGYTPRRSRGYSTSSKETDCEGVALVVVTQRADGTWEIRRPSSRNVNVSGTWTVRRFGATASKTFAAAAEMMDWVAWYMHGNINDPRFSL